MEASWNIFTCPANIEKIVSTPPTWQSAASAVQVACCRLQAAGCKRLANGGHGRLAGMGMAVTLGIHVGQVAAEHQEKASGPTDLTNTTSPTISTKRCGASDLKK